MTTWFKAVASLRASRRPGVFVTVTDVRGHAPRDAGAKMVVSGRRDLGFDRRRQPRGGGGAPLARADRRAGGRAGVVRREPVRQGAVPARRPVLRGRRDRADGAARRRPLGRDLRGGPRRPRARADPGPPRPRPAPRRLPPGAPVRRRPHAPAGRGRDGARARRPRAARAGDRGPAARHPGAGADARPRRGPRAGRRGAASHAPGSGRADRLVGEVGAVPRSAGRRRHRARGGRPGRDADRLPGRDHEQGTGGDRGVRGRCSPGHLRARRLCPCVSTLLPGHLHRHPSQPVHRCGPAVRGGRRPARAGRCDRRARPPFADLSSAHPDEEVVDLREGLVLPGFVDTHVHFPQVRAIGGLGMPLSTGSRSARSPRRRGSRTRPTPPRWPPTSSPAWPRPGPPPRSSSAPTSPAPSTRCSPRPPGSASGSPRASCCPTGSCARTCSRPPSAPSPRDSSSPRGGTASGRNRYAVTPPLLAVVHGPRCWSRQARCRPRSTGSGSPRT